MRWEEALERAVAATRHERYRALCAPDHPDREHWRRVVLEVAGAAGGPAPDAPHYPPIATQAANLAGAVGRVIAAAVRGDPIRAPAPVHDERLAICRDCEFNGERPSGVRCTKCGCGGIKLTLATESCPAGKWGPSPA